MRNLTSTTDPAGRLTRFGYYPDGKLNETQKGPTPTHKPVSAFRREAVKHEFDYIIVGAGSGGCVLANRLSANPNHRVLLIEAGGRDNRLAMRMPLAMMSLVLNPAVTWGFETDPEPHVTTVGCPSRAAGCWAARRRSTPCFMPGVTPWTTTNGGTWV